MTKILITGGLGFLGQHLVKALLNNDEDSEILILARSRGRVFLDDLNNNRVKTVHGVDLSHKESMESHFSNADYVFHTAALISFWYKDKKRMDEINIGGTKNVVDLCFKYGIKRLVHVSSTAAIKGSTNIDKAADETSGYDWRGKAKYDYGLSKFHAEKEIERGIAQGLEAVIANPCSILGYGDAKIFPLIETVLKQTPVCFSGGSHMVDVRDLAQGLTLLLAKGKSGERYLLVGNYHTQMEILTSLSRILKVRPPVFVIPSKALVVAIPFLAITDVLSRAKPKLTRTMVMNGLSPVFFSNMKSSQMLNWTPRHNLDASLAEAVRYYKETVK